MSQNDITKITIANEYWDERDVNEISELFSDKFSVVKKEIGRWEAEELAPVLWLGFVWVGQNIAAGFLNALGSDLWNSLKDKLAKKQSEKNYSEFRFSIEGSNQKISLDMNTNNPELLKRGLDTVDRALQQIDPSEVRQDFHFDNEKQEWIKEGSKKIVKTITGVSIAAEVPFEKNGKTIRLRKEDLPDIATRQVGLPLTLGHGGRSIGVITKAWVDDNKVKFEAGIFDGLTEDEQKELDKTHGISMEFSHSGFEAYTVKEDKDNQKSS